MTKTILKPQLLLIFSSSSSSNSQSFSRKLSKNSRGLKHEKITHLHFYFQDIVIGRHPTAIRVITPTKNTTRSQFGLVTMMDDLLTVGPEPESKIVGRAQGIYASADLNDIGFLMVLNYCFTEGKYNGSTLSILGRNRALMPMREMPVVGGSGLFRFARGYAQAKTHTFDLKSGNAVVEYNMVVRHY